MDKKKIEQKINKLFDETRVKLAENSISEKVILIDFVYQYNKIYSEAKNE